MIKTAFFFRKPFPGYHSMEELFDNIIKHLPGDIEPQRNESRFLSSGLLKRIYNIVEARFRQAEVNHITGDIHYIAALLKKQKTILTIHDLEIIKRSRYIKRNLLLFFWFYLPVKRVRYITVISEFTKKELQQFIHIPSHKIRVIPDCIPGKIDYCPKPFNTLYPVILQIGTKPHKNIPHLVEAIKNIPCKLIIIGKLDDDLTALLKWDHIDYENYVDLKYEEVIELYKRSDMLAFVSKYEGFGLPILEAQAIGRPIITSNVASMPEAAGDGALLVDPFDIKAIRKAVKQIINDSVLREQLIAKGLENIKHFTPDAVAKEYAKLYREVVGRED
jgi:glycosyltransferase involved in cell wall biosynthesis